MKFARPSTTFAVAIVALLGLGACTSTPSAKAVAEDYVESIDGLTDEAAAVHAGEARRATAAMSSKRSARPNLNVDFDQADAVQTATPEFQAFVENLNTCMGTAGSG